MAEIKRWEISVSGQNSKVSLKVAENQEIREE